jgi:hypothetical protein
MLSLTQIPLTQQWITTLGEALEQVMKIEAMDGYPGSLRKSNTCKTDAHAEEESM